MKRFFVSCIALRKIVNFFETVQRPTWKRVNAPVRQSPSWLAALPPCETMRKRQHVYAPAGSHPYNLRLQPIVYSLT